MALHKLPGGSSTPAGVLASTLIGRPHRTGTALTARSCTPALAGALVEVYWEAPSAEAQPPTGWYSARVLEMAHVVKKQGTAWLQDEQSQSVEMLNIKQLTVRWLSAYPAAPMDG